MIEREDRSIPEKIVEAEAPNEERESEVGLRPQTLQDFIGQNDIKDNLSIFMQAAKKREEPIEHVLLYGNPGLGKTTLAHIIAHEMGSQIRVTSGSALERVGGWRNGIRRGLKIPRGKPHVGSTPTSPTTSFAKDVAHQTMHQTRVWKMN